MATRTAKFGEARFEGKGKVIVRCGGQGTAWVGKDVHVSTAGGSYKTVRLEKLVVDYGPGDVCEFTISWR